MNLKTRLTGLINGLLARREGKNVNGLGALSTAMAKTGRALSTGIDALSAQ
jgi:hypothetical protein